MYCPLMTFMLGLLHSCLGAHMTSDYLNYILPSQKKNIVFSAMISDQWPEIKLRY